MCVAMAWPWSGPSRSARSTSISSVPWRSSTRGVAFLVKGRMSRPSTTSGRLSTIEGLDGARAVSVYWQIWILGNAPSDRSRSGRASDASSHSPRRRPRLLGTRRPGPRPGDSCVFRRAESARCDSLKTAQKSTGGEGAQATLMSSQKRRAQETTAPRKGVRYACGAAERTAYINNYGIISIDFSQVSIS